MRISRFTSAILVLFVFAAVFIADLVVSLEVWIFHASPASNRGLHWFLGVLNLTAMIMLGYGLIFSGRALMRLYAEHIRASLAGSAQTTSSALPSVAQDGIGAGAHLP